MMCNGADEMRKLADWDGKGQLSRQKLMEKLQGGCLSKFMMI